MLDFKNNILVQNAISTFKPHMFFLIETHLSANDTFGIPHYKTIYNRIHTHHKAKRHFAEYVSWYVMILQYYTLPIIGKLCDGISLKCKSSGLFILFMGSYMPPEYSMQKLYIIFLSTSLQYCLRIQILYVIPGDMNVIIGDKGKIHKRYRQYWRPSCLDFSVNNHGK